MNCTEFAARLEEYVAGFLSAEEQQAVDEHAHLCPNCGLQLGQAEAAAAVIRLSIPQVEPPAALRRRILSAAHRGSAGADRRRAAWWRALTPTAAVLSLLALALTLGLAGWVIALRGEIGLLTAENGRLSEQLAQQRTVVAALLGSPERRERPLAGSENAPAARGQVYYVPAQRQGVLLINDLVQPAADRSYQVWGRSQGGPVSLGLVRFDTRGNAYALLDSPVPFGQFEAIGISLEPVGGSPRPTGPNMLRGQL